MEPLIALTLDRAGDTDRNRRFYAGRDMLRIEYQIDAVDSQQIVATEASVLWFTEGKGEPDMGVHFFRRTARDSHADRDLRPMQRIEVPLPPSPLSYEGVILKIRWCVRVRLFLTGGREFLEERGFTLGKIPPAVAVEDRPLHDETEDDPSTGDRQLAAETANTNG
jgi:hypothetical protein